jgi:hypothetical protein
MVLSIGVIKVHMKRQRGFEDSTESTLIFMKDRSEMNKALTKNTPIGDTNSPDYKELLMWITHLKHIICDVQAIQQFETTNALVSNAELLQTNS